MRNYARELLLAAFVIFYIVSLCCNGVADSAIDEKADHNLAAFLMSDEPATYTKSHDIEMKDGLVKIILEVNGSLFSDEIISKYDLKDLNRRKDKITAYADIVTIKALCEEPAVTRIRLPVKFRAQ